MDAFTALKLGFTRADITDLVRHADTNGDGYLNYHEFAQSFSTPTSQNQSLAEQYMLLKRKKSKRARAGVLSGLALMAADSKHTKSQPIDEADANSRYPKHLTYAQLSALGSLFLISGGSATVTGGVVSARTGYRPTISPRGVQLTEGRWFYEGQYARTFLFLLIRSLS